MNSPGGMATTPSSGWRRRRSCSGDQFADLRLGFFAVGDRPVLAEAADKLVNVAVTPAVLVGGSRSA